MSNNLKGIVLVLVAGLAWGISGVSGQYLMARGLSVNVLTSLRLLVSGFLLTIFIFTRQRSTLVTVLKDRQTLGRIAFFSIAGITANQYTYLLAIRYTNAGTATVLQYITPVLILAFISLKNRKLPTMIEIFSIMAAIFGTFLIATHGQIGTLAITPKGLIWGLASAITYSLYILLPIKVIRQWGSLLVIGLGMLFGGLTVSMLTQPWKEKILLDNTIFLALFGLIIIGSLFAYTAFLKGVTMVGAVKGSLLSSVEPVASVLFSAIIMHDVFYPIDFLGIFCILSAVLIISLKDLILSKKKPLG